MMLAQAMLVHFLDRGTTVCIGCVELVQIFINYRTFEDTLICSVASF